MSPKALKGFESLADWTRNSKVLAGPKVPSPYRKLLVHKRDMTTTLDVFHGEPIALRVLFSARNGNLYRREVVLATADSGKPVEYGAISIHLETLPAAARKLVLEAKRPLGAILHGCDVKYTSHPTAYFRITPDATILVALGLKRARPLYGRCNELRDSKKRTIARIVEILPPTR